jgi:hypothetical protein
MPTKREKLFIEAGRDSYEVRRTHHETSEVYHTVIYYHGISFRTAYGIEYTLRHTWEDTPEGAIRAERFARRVQAVVDAKGIDGLNLNCWADRVMYGTQAYLDEEPLIVAREREDALLGDY